MVQRSVSNRPIVLDACCLINLAATQRLEELLASVPAPIWVADLVLDTETLFLRRGGGGEDADERERIDLERLQEIDLLAVVKAETDAERITFITLAVDLDDGEALTGALAIHRRADVATDDRKAIRVLTTADSDLRIWRTSELVKHWADVGGVARAEVGRALRSIEDRARFRPGRNDPLHEWWAVASRL